ncbi:MAG: tRNA preQ1(34) S-adenosylmethionine ribosyltransferase-isomerase QueA [Gammaproteobacteria bacterium]
MKRSDFNYHLPKELIAQHPLAERAASRMLCLDGDSGRIKDAMIRDLPEYVRAGDLLVFNDTRVIPARLLGHKDSGGKVEVMVERLDADGTIWALMKASKAARPGTGLSLGESGALKAEVLGRDDDLFHLRLEGVDDAVAELERHGSIPLPPYIERQVDDEDLERYQTQFAREPGAVAAPTAGLHFDQALLDALAAQGIDFGFVTLHVGAGTFQPVRADDIRDHRMHAEYLKVGQELVDQINVTKAHGGRVIAVGTTSVRSLETAARDGELRAYAGLSDIFIYPGYEFRVVDAMVTNFHLPESTLLMLVSAFAGRENILKAYEHAVQQCYRFFSYGDAMFLTR